MVLVRRSLWHFKKDKREETFLELDRILNTSTRKSDGFRGYVSLLSHKDINSATVLTLWQDEESLKTSEKEVFAQATKKVKDTLESPTRIENYRMFSAIFQ